MFRILAAALGAAFLLPAIAHAQDTSGYKVAPCVTQTGGNGIPYCAPVTSANPLPVTTTSGASGWSVGDGASGNPYSLTTSPTTITLPSPYTTVQVQNTGTSDAATCELGGTIDTKTVNIPAQSSVPFSVGSATQITCQSATTTTSVAVLGGSGFTAVGGGGGGGGGSVTQGTVPWVDNITQWNGVNVVGGSGNVTGGSPRIAIGRDTSTIGGAAPGTAGTPSANVLTVQGVTSMTPLLAGVSGTSVTGFALPTACSGATDFNGYLQCMIVLGNAALPAQASNTAVQIGATLPAYGADGGGSSTGTGTFTILAASGNAGLKEYLTGLQCGRSDAGTTAITVAISDGTKTRTFVIPNNGGGGGNNVTLQSPIQFAANTAVTAAFGTGVTTGFCNAEGYYAP